MNENTNPFAEALAKMIPADNPDPSFNVDIDQLDTGYRTAIENAITDGQLDCLTTRGVRLVSVYDLFELAGPNADPTDPNGAASSHLTLF